VLDQELWFLGECKQSAGLARDREVQTGEVDAGLCGDAPLKHPRRRPRRDRHTPCATDSEGFQLLVEGAAASCRAASRLYAPAGRCIAEYLRQG
jgi:hypothetical protein